MVRGRERLRFAATPGRVAAGWLAVTQARATRSNSRLPLPASNVIGEKEVTALELRRKATSRPLNHQ